MLKLQLAVGCITTHHLILRKHARVFHEAGRQNTSAFGLVLSRNLRLLSLLIEEGHVMTFLGRARQIMALHLRWCTTRRLLHQIQQEVTLTLLGRLITL
jgi:hypothetical protein